MYILGYSGLDEYVDFKKTKNTELKQYRKKR